MVLPDTSLTSPSSADTAAPPATPRELLLAALTLIAAIATLPLLGGTVLWTRPMWMDELCTAFVTDLGMCGPRDSIIGVDPAGPIQKFLTGMPARFVVAERSPAVQFNSVLFDVDDRTGKARSIERVDREWMQDGE